MSIENEIERIQNNIENAYSTLSDLGATMPETRNSNNLSSTAASVAAVLYSEQQLTDEQKTQARENIGAVQDFGTSISYQYDFSTIPSVTFDVATMYKCYKISDVMMTKEQILKSSITSDYGSMGSSTRTPVESEILSDSDDYFIFQFSTTPRNGFLTAYTSGSLSLSINGYDIPVTIPETGTYMVLAMDLVPESELVITSTYSESSIPEVLITEIDNRIENYIENNDISSGDTLSFINLNTLTATLEPNTIYDFGTLNDGDSLDITFYKPYDATGAELWHGIFIAGAAHHDIQMKTSDNSSLKIYGPDSYVVGDAYEISMLDDIVHIGCTEKVTSNGSGNNELSFVTVTSKTVTLEPNVIYDFGSLNASDVIDITFNKPANATGAELWHAIFIAGATQHNIQARTSDGSALKVYGPEEFKVGVTYEMSMLNNVIFIG